MLWGRHKKQVLGKNKTSESLGACGKARVAGRVCKNDGVRTKTSGNVEWREHGELQLAKPSCNGVRARPGHESVHETC